MLGEMRVQRQRHGSFRNFFGDEEIALAITEIEILALKMERLRIGAGADFLGA